VTDKDEETSSQASTLQTLLSDSVFGVVWSGIQKGGASVISVLVHIVLARLLLPKHFGLVAMANVAVAFIGLVKDQGFGAAIIQRDNLEDKHLDAALWTVLVVGIVLAAAGIGAAPWVALFFDSPRLEPVLQVLVLSIPLASVSSIPEALLRRRMEFKSLSIRTLIANVVGGAVAVGAAFAGWGVWALVALSLTKMLVSTVVLWIATGWLPGLTYSIRHMKDLFSFGANITGQKILNFFNRQADDIIIGYFLGASALGFYSVAYEILKGMTNIVSRTMTNVALPAFSRLQNDIPRLKRAFLTAVRTTSVVSIPIFVLYAVVAEDLFLVIYNPKWLPAVSTSQVLAFIGILHSLVLFNPPILKSLGKPHWELALSVLNVVGNLTGFLIGVQYGFFWVAVAYVARGYLFAPVELYLVQTLIDFEVSEYVDALVFPLIGAVLVAVSVFGVHQLLPEATGEYISLASGLLAGGGAYAVYAYLALPDRTRRLVGRIRQELGV
jgi:PST family polysaccharide transporter